LNTKISICTSPRQVFLKKPETSVENFSLTTTTEKIAKFMINMKKFVVPAVLFVLAAALVAYLALDFSGSRSSFNSEAYLAERAKIDSLEVELWSAQGNPDAQVAIRTELAAAWETLAALRSGPTAEENAAPESGEQAGEQSADQTASAAGQSMSSDVILWIVGGAAAIILCIVVLILLLKRRQVIITQKMEAVKAAERFKEPKGGFDDAVTLVSRPRPQKRSIIADAEEYAAQKRETMAQQATDRPSDAEQKVAFEDENGVPENKILTGSPESRPTLRPTAKERITSAMQNLSDVLRAPRGLSRERTMRLRAQSHNVTGDPSLAGSSPLEITRFDRENSEKNKILQLSRRGVPASIIASRMKLPQDKVESIIRENQD